MASARTLLAAVGMIGVAALAVQAIGGPASIELPPGRWELVAGIVGGESIPIGQGRQPITLQFEDEEASGWGPCNGFSGPVMVGPSGLQLGPFMATDMGCRGVAGDVEHAYLVGLLDVTAVQSSTQELLLSGPTVVLEFRPYLETSHNDLDAG